MQTLPNQKIRIRSLNFGTTSVVLAGFRFGGMQAIAELFPIRGLLLARVQGGSVKPQWFLLLGWFLFWARSIFGGGGGSGRRGSPCPFSPNLPFALTLWLDLFLLLQLRLPAQPWLSMSSPFLCQLSDHS